jgi:hypothetical protein
MLAVLVIGMGVVLALVSMATRKSTNDYPQPGEAGPPPDSRPPAPAPSAGFPPSTGTSIGPSIAGDLAGGLAAGAGIVAGEEIARHLLNSGEHEVNAPSASELAHEQHEGEHLGVLDFGVSRASSWDDDDRASGGDDWT